MPTTKGLYTTNRAYVKMLRGTYATVAYDGAGPTYVSDPAFSFNSLLLTGEPDYLPFIADNSLNNLNITVVGDTKSNNFNPYTPGYYSNYFDGTGDYLTTPNIGSITGDFTIEGWFYSEIPTNTWYPYFFGSNSPWTVGGGIGLYYSTQTTVAAATAVYVTCSGSGFQVCTFADIQNRWCHIALVRSGSTLTVYLDGVSKGTMTASGTIATTTFLINGTDEGGSYDNHASKGYISNFRIIKGTALYTSAFTPPTSPLTAVSGTALLTCQSNSLIDKSTNAYTITKNGDSKVVAANPFDLPTSYATYGSSYFDGTGDYLTAPTSSVFSLAGNFTIECWLYPTAFSSYKSIWSGTNAINSTGFHIGLNSSGNIFIYSNSSFTVTSSNAMTLNAWNHVAVVRNGGVVYIYINGVVSTNSWTTSTAFTNAACVIGTNPGPGTEYYFGYITDFRIINGTAVYTGNFTPPTAPLSIAGSTSQYAVTANVNTTFPSANTSLSLLQTSQPHNNNAFLDKSNFRQLITRNGNPFSGTFSPYGANWSGYFDGSSYIITATSTAFGFGTGDYTVEFWYYSADDSYSYPWDFRVSGGGSGQTRPLMSIDATNTIFYIGTSAKITTTGVPQRTWTHVALVRQTGVTKIYLNGVLTGTPYTGSEDFGSTNTLSLSTVGDTPGYSTTELVGNMSNFRVVKGVAVYTGNFTPSTTPLTTTIAAAANVTAVSSANISYIGLNSYNLADTSINKISQTITGTVVAQTFSPFGLAANTSPLVTGGSLYIDGTGDYLDFPASNPVLKMGTGDFTIEFWVYPTTAPNNNWSPFLTIGTSGGGQEIRISQNLNGTGFGYLIPNNTNNGDVYPGFGTLPILQWSHIALVRSGSTVTMYRNGTSVGSTTSVSFNHTSTAVCRIGYPQPAYADGSTAGYISDLRIVKNAVYLGNFTPPSLPLTLSGNSAIYSNTTNVNTTFSVANTAALLNFTDAAIKDSTMYVNLETVGDTKLGFETAYSGSYYSNYFDGAGDYLVSSSMSMTLGTSNFCMEAWGYWTSFNAGTYGAPLFSFSATNTQLMLRATKTSASSTSVNYYSVNNSNFIPSAGFSAGVSAGTIYLNTWNHIALTREGSTWRLFVNGVLVSTQTDASSLSTAYTSVTLGADSTPSNGYLTGWLSNARMVVGNAVYTTDFTPPTQPLTAISGTQLLSAQSNRFIDNSTNNLTFTKTGEVAVKSFNPFQRNTGSSLFFDGSGDYLQIATNSSLDFGTGDFAVEAWVNPTYLSSDFFIISASGSGGFFVGYSSSTTLGWGWGRNGTAWDYRVGSTATANTWQHVAVTRSGTSMRLFVNGLQQGTTQTISTSYNLGTTSTTIGSQGANYYLTGYIDDLRVTRGNARYTANFTPSTNMLQVR